MSEVERSLIKVGFWTNHAQGTVLGATITLDQSYSNVIVALVAVVVAAAASSAFNLVLFALYQIRATDRPKDGLYRQQQALYRTLATPGTVLVDSLKFLSAWRRRTSTPILARCLAPALLGLVFALGSLAAGVFSSYIVTSTDLEVLIRPDNCRLLNYTAFNTVDSGDTTFLTTLHSAALSFAQRCYTPGPLPSACNFYIHPRIEPALLFDDCPFDRSLCLNGTKAAILDTGYLDSNDDLGINALPQDRVLIRRRTSCVPLDTSKRTNVYRSNDTAIADLVKDQYPPELAAVNTWVTISLGTGPGPFDNITTKHSSLAANVTLTYTFSSAAAYQNPNPRGSYFTPIEGLAQERGDVTLVFVYANFVQSFTPIDDPIYSAHKEIPYPDTTTAYAPDFPISTLGCIEKWEFCIRSGNELECTPPVGAMSNFEPLRKHVPSANAVQQATFDVIASITFMTGLTDAAQLAMPFLNVTSRLYEVPFVQDIPADQWVRDFQALESYVWSFNRLAILNHFTGFPGVLGNSTIPSVSPAAKQVCRNQKVKEAGNFANINVFGIAFTLAVAGTLLLLDFIGLRIYTIRGQLSKLPAVQSWIDDGVYELQRRAYEPYVKAPWERTDKEVPITAKGQMLQSLSRYAAAVSLIAPVNLGQHPSQPDSVVQGRKASLLTASVHSAGAISQAAIPLSPTNTTQLPSPNHNQAINIPTPTSSAHASRTPSTASRSSSLVSMSRNSSTRVSATP